MPIPRVKRRLAWRKDPPDPRDHQFSVPLPTLQALPPSVTLADNFAIYDQGQIGSCSANALAAAVQFDRVKNGETPPFEPSRLFIYYNERQIEGDVPLDGGAYLRDGVKSLQQQGVCPETLWPYDSAPPATDGGPFPVGSRAVTQPPQPCYDAAANYTISDYQIVSQNLSQLQGCLASGFPFAFGFSVFDSWYDASPVPTVIPMPSQSDRVVGGHAVLCVGYDNTTNLFRIRNSWGAAEGDNGYFYMPYAYLLDSNLSNDCWVINAVKS